MGYNKFKTKSGTVLLDLTSDTIVPEELSEGITAHNKNGEKITGTFTIDNELSTQTTLLSDQDAKLAELAEILSNKATATPTLQDKTVTPTTATQNVIADSGYDGLSKVTVNGDANLISENIAEGINIFGVSGTYSGGSGSVVETCAVTLKQSSLPMSQCFTTVFDQSSDILSSYSSEIGLSNPYIISNVVCGTMLVLRTVLPIVMGYSVTGGAEFVEFNRGIWVFYIPQHPDGDIIITVREDD